MRRFVCVCVCFFVVVFAFTLSRLVCNASLSYTHTGQRTMRQYRFISHSIINTNSNNLINGAIFLLLASILHFSAESEWITCDCAHTNCYPRESNNRISDISTCIPCLMLAPIVVLLACSRSHSSYSTFQIALTSHLCMLCSYTHTPPIIYYIQSLSYCKTD